MKAKVILMMVLLSASFLNLNFGQQSKSKTFKVWVEIADVERKVMGQLLELRDSSVLIQHWKEEKVEEIAVSQIEKLKFRRKGAVGKGAGIGAGIGLLSGLLLGQAEGDDEPNPQAWIDFSMSADEKSAVYAPGLGALGAATGAVIGALKKKYTVNSDQTRYESIKSELSKYLAARSESIE